MAQPAPAQASLRVWRTQVPNGRFVGCRLPADPLRLGPTGRCLPHEAGQVGLRATPITELVPGSPPPAGVFDVRAPILNGLLNFACQLPIESCLPQTPVDDGQLKVVSSLCKYVTRLSVD